MNSKITMTARVCTKGTAEKPAPVGKLSDILIKDRHGNSDSIDFRNYTATCLNNGLGRYEIKAEIDPDKNKKYALEDLGSVIRIKLRFEQSEGHTSDWPDIESLTFENDIWVCEIRKERAQARYLLPQ